jgi:hypothetical protein
MSSLVQAGFRSSCTEYSISKRDGLATLTTFSDLFCDIFFTFYLLFLYFVTFLQRFSQKAIGFKPMDGAYKRRNQVPTTAPHE